MPTPIYELIETITFTGTETGFTFSSIPQNYTHLVLEGVIDPSGLTSIYFRLNNDVSTNIYRQYHGQNNTTERNSTSANNPQLLGASVIQNTAIKLEFANYSNDSIFTRLSYNLSEATDLNLRGFAVYPQTTALNQIDIFIDGDDFISAGSYVKLFGIAGA